MVRMRSTVQARQVALVGQRLSDVVFFFEFSNDFSNDFFNLSENKKIHQTDCSTLHEFVSLHVDK